MRYAMLLFVLLSGLACPMALAGAPVDPDAGLWCFAPDRRQAQLEREAELMRAISPQRLRSWHDMVASEPHPAGTPADRRLIRRLATELTAAGLDVEVQWFYAYLSEPVSGRVVIEQAGDEPIELPVMEEPAAGDESSADPEVWIGFNAYAATGDVTAPVVYANYGTKEDFEELERLGIEVEGKVVLARYGGNYRGYKAYYAERAGALGLVIYTDPANDGAGRGPVYPEGGWANESSIQRGSILVAPYPGDPLTPGEFASDDALRLNPVDAPLPKIPVQPIGSAAARAIVSRMSGEMVPDGWAGGLGVPYALTGGDDLRVRVAIEQKRGFKRTANVIATIEGATEPQLEIIAGCHHDSWSHGAGDPGAGTIVLLELARVFGERLMAGERPDRTLRFAFWGAEEYGIIGSTEYVESREAELHAGGVAYINLDMAAMGDRFRASASPSLGRWIEEAAMAVPAVGDAGRSAWDVWRGTGERPRIGDMGGGSDHVGFLCRAGVASCGLGSRGAQGVAYHSAYDTLEWYRKVVGTSYEPAAMVTRVAAVMMSRGANADVLPLDPAGYGPVLVRAIDTVRVRIEDEMPASRDIFEQELGRWAPGLIDAWKRIGTEMATPVVGEQVDFASHNRALIAVDRAWVDANPIGLPGREWFRSALAASDETSGYRAWILPGLHGAIERSSPQLLAEQVRVLGEAMRRAQAAATRSAVDAP